MVSRAVERSEGYIPDSFDLQRRVDAEIWQVLHEAGDFSRDMIRRLKYRQLLKVCLSRRKQDLSEGDVRLLTELASDSKKRMDLEDEIARRAGLEPGYVAIDVPNIKLLLSEPRMSQVDIRIIGDDGKTRWFREHTPLAEALRKRQVSQAVFYVMTIPGFEGKVSQISEDVLFT